MLIGGGASPPMGGASCCMLPVELLPGDLLLIGGISVGNPEEREKRGDERRGNEKRK
jgi:hypothetical protein